MSVGGVERPPRIADVEPTDWRKWSARTGWIHLDFVTEPDRWVSPGTGRIEMLGEGPGERLVLTAARRHGTPVLPGSGIKGAARTLYELVTGSCTPFDGGGACCSCPACSLFGCIGKGGHRGCLGFDDADGGEVQVATEEVPIPFPPHAEKTPGDVRLYDLKPKPDAERVLAREAYRGTFRGRFVFDSVSELELGRLLLCLGLGPDDLDFPFRVGGVRYDGQGAVRVTLGEGRFADGAIGRTTVNRDDLQKAADGWMATAFEALGARQQAALRQIGAILRRTTA